MNLIFVTFIALFHSFLALETKTVWYECIYICVSNKNSSPWKHTQDRSSHTHTKWRFFLCIPQKRHEEAWRLIQVFQCDCRVSSTYASTKTIFSKILAEDWNVRGRSSSSADVLFYLLEDDTIDKASMVWDSNPKYSRQWHLRHWHDRQMRATKWFVTYVYVNACIVCSQ